MNKISPSKSYQIGAGKHGARKRDAKPARIAA